jgi:hypothetical protein
VDTSTYKACKQCGEYFHADQDWKHICIGCFKENKRKEREQEQFREQFRYKPGKSTYQTPPAPAIPPDMLKVLIMLCHPDRHQGKQMATEATQWLLKQRTISNG